MSDDPMYFPAMERCDQCGQFMKRGLWNWIAHLEICKGKPKPWKRNNDLPTVYLTPSLAKELDKIQMEYFKNKQNEL